MINLYIILVYNDHMTNDKRITFYGDFTFGENYQAKYDFQDKINILRQRGYDFLFDNVKHFLYGSDFNVVNLETPLTNIKASYLEGKKAVTHWSDPEIAPRLLKKYKIHAVSLGNNHGFDYGEEGLRQSLDVLKKENIFCFGAGMNEQDAKKPLKKEFIINKTPFNLYIFGGYKYREDYDKDFNFYAKDKKAGVNLLTLERTADEIKNIKANDPCAFVVIFIHFGFDLQKTVSAQIEAARGFIDCGADLVAGHGPHMINQIEIYKQKPIIYSLGNFIFPADFKGRCSPYNLIAMLNVREENDNIKTSISLYPIHMDTNSKTPKTRLIRKDEVDEVLNHLCRGNEEIKKIFKVSEDNFAIRICADGL